MDVVQRIFIGLVINRYSLWINVNYWVIWWVMKLSVKYNNWNCLGFLKQRQGLWLGHAELTCAGSACTLPK